MVFRGPNPRIFVKHQCFPKGFPLEELMDTLRAEMAPAMSTFALDDLSLCFLVAGNNVETRRWFCFRRREHHETSPFPEEKLLNVA